jgi:hypothetical protein
LDFLDRNSIHPTNQLLVCGKAIAERNMLYLTRNWTFEESGLE